MSSNYTIFITLWFLYTSNKQEMVSQTISDVSVLVDLATSPSLQAAKQTVVVSIKTSGSNWPFILALCERLRSGFMLHMSL